MKKIIIVGIAFFCLSTNSHAGKVIEFFGMGSYQDGKRSWNFRTYDQTVEARFDDDGKNVGANRYSAFGNRISDHGDPSNREAFQGQDFRAEINQYNLGARTMNPDFGQWLLPEPAIIIGSFCITEPLSFNPYRYAGNNPINFTDPSGWASLPNGGYTCRPDLIDTARYSLSDTLRGDADLFRYTALHYGGNYAGMYDTMANISDGLANAVRPDDAETYACRPYLSGGDLAGFGMPSAMRPVVKEFKLFWNIPVRELQPLTQGEFSLIKARMLAMGKIGSNKANDYVLYDIKDSSTLMHNEIRQGGSIIFEYSGSATETELGILMKDMIEWAAKQSEAEGSPLELIFNFNGNANSLYYSIGQVTEAAH